MSKYTVDDVIDGDDQPAWFTRRILRYLESIRRSEKPWASLRRVRNEFHRNHHEAWFIASVLNELVDLGFAEKRTKRRRGKSRDSYRFVTWAP